MARPEHCRIGEPSSGRLKTPRETACYLLNTAFTAERFRGLIVLIGVSKAGFRRRDVVINEVDHQLTDR
jgi:hypothetical protein